MNMRQTIERIRDSQFLVPATGIVVSAVLAVITHNLDRSSFVPAFLISASTESARTLLATVAGAIITVAALVFSFTAVTVQMAASQYSPRIVQEVLRDRFQQWTVALVMGTFTFAVLGLAVFDTPNGESPPPDWTVTVAVVSGVASAVSIVAFIDHVTRRLRIDDTIRRISLRVQHGFRVEPQTSPVIDEKWEVPEGSDAAHLRSDTTGFVQGIDVIRLLERLPAGAVARLDTWTGEFVGEGARLLTVWSDEPLPEDVQATIAIGDTRTVEQDPGLGIRQLVDVALRALSPGVNDPATAADVVRHLMIGLRSAHRMGARDRSFTAENGTRLLTPEAPTTSDYVSEALSEIRHAARDQPFVLAAMVDSAEALAEELAVDGIDCTALRHESEAAAMRLGELRELML